MWSNFHTHTYHCDGKGTPEDYLRRAKDAGIASLGFSSHAPIPFPCKWCMKAEAFLSYRSAIDALETAFPDIEIYQGLEVDFIPGIISPSDFAARLDYTIGSIHFVDSFQGQRWEIDSTLEIFREGLRKIFRDDVRAAVTRYLELTREMVVRSPPDIVGHLDKIKIHNTPAPWFEESEGWYKEEIEKTLSAIRETRSIIEVNTRGLYKKKAPTTYPSPWILERICERNIPVTLSSDAHHPEELIREFPAVAALLIDIGFKNFSILKGGMWKQMPLHEYGFDH